MHIVGEQNNFDKQNKTHTQKKIKTNGPHHYLLNIDAIAPSSHFYLSSWRSRIKKWHENDVLNKFDFTSSPIMDHTIFFRIKGKSFIWWGTHSGTKFKLKW